MNPRDLVAVPLFAALIVALGVMPPIPLGFLPVPITLQTLGVMLAGAMLGPWRGALAPALVVLLVILGLPVLSGGRGGLGVLAGPTAGFLIGWIPGALVTGLLARPVLRRGGQDWRVLLGLLLACVLGGIAVIYALGIAWLALVGGVGFGAAALGSLAFLPGDLVKAVIAAGATRAVQRVYPLQ
ncbi:biotin transporter BioY [Aquibaculum sediminis]|uniref:biotin transporter BioY n=1 Tax=Aquibaculum sediminis TaxID=3231907 RepID=UPI003452A898